MIWSPLQAELHAVQIMEPVGEPPRPAFSRKALLVQEGGPDAKDPLVTANAPSSRKTMVIGGRKR